MEPFKVAVIIPAYNEETTIKDVINSVQKYGTPIVIDDGSVDSTAKISTNSGAIVEKHKKNQGYDKALNSGFKIANKKNFDIVITVDADMQHDLKILPKFINLLKTDVEIVAGIRSKNQRFSEWIFRALSNSLWGLKDPLCGLKGYKMHIYREIGYFDSYNSIGTEMLIRSKLKNKIIKQINIYTRDRIDNPRFGNLLTSNYKILRSLFLSLLLIRK